MSVDGHTTVVALGLLQAALHERIVIHERRLRCRTWREKFRRSFLHHENRASVLRWPSVLILLLTVCALLAAYVAHPRREHWLMVEMIIICAVLTLNIYLLTWDDTLRSHEHIDRAQHVLEKLKDSIEAGAWRPERYVDVNCPLSPCVSLQWTVRDGQLVNLPVCFLVVGDVVLLRPGQVIPARCQQHSSEPDKPGVVHKGGGVFSPWIEHSDLFSKPQARQPAKPVFCWLLETPFINNFNLILECGDSRPASVLNQQRHKVCSFWLERLLLPAVLVVVFSINITRYIILSENVGHWSEMFLIIPAQVVLPLCAVLFPMMWTLLDASGLARFIVLFKQFRNEQKSSGCTCEEAGRYDDLEGSIFPAEVDSDWAYTATWREVWREFLCVLSGRTGTLARTANVVHTLGNVTSFCCVDKKGLLSWPNPTAEKVFFLRNNATPAFTVSSHDLTLDGDADDQSAGGGDVATDATSSTSLHHDDTPDADFAMESIVEVLDLTQDAKNGYSLQFDDPTWKLHESSLKPLGLNILLNTCNMGTADKYTEFADHVTCASFKREGSVPVVNRRVIEVLSTVRRRCFCELSRQIGFEKSASSIFTLQQQLGIYRLIPPELNTGKRLTRPTVKYRMPLPNMFSVIVKETRSQSLQLFSQGTADLLLDACTDYWDGNDLCPLNEAERKKIADFYHRTSMSSYCTAFSYRPVTQTLTEPLGDVYTEVPPSMQHYFSTARGSRNRLCVTDPLEKETMMKSFSSVDSLLTEGSTCAVSDIVGCLRLQSDQVFIGMITMQYQAKQDMVQLIDELEQACIRFAHFSKENELRSRVFSEKMGLEAGWNCHISLLSDSRPPEGCATSEPRSSGSDSPPSPPRPPAPPRPTHHVSAPRLVTLTFEGKASRRDVGEEMGLLEGEEGGEWEGGEEGEAEGRRWEERGSVGGGYSPSTDDSMIGGLGFSNRAKLPKGIENIRPHLAHIDNVPLLVSLFTDCTPATTQEMLRILQENGEVVCCLGSAVNIDNTGVFLQADCSLAVEPLYPQICTKLRSSPSYGGATSPLSMCAMLQSVACSLSFRRDDPVKFIRLIMVARHHCESMRATFLFLLTSQLAVSAVQLAGCCLPPPLGPPHTLWLAVVVLPTLATAMMDDTLQPASVGRMALGKNRDHVPLKTVLQYAVSTVARHGISVVVCLVCHMLILNNCCRKVARQPDKCDMLLGDRGYTGRGRTWNGWGEEHRGALTLSQNFVTLQLTVYFVCSSACSMHRLRHTWQRSPHRHRLWSRLATTLLIVQVILFVLSTALNQAGGFRVSDIPVASWAVAFLWPFILVPMLELIKRTEIKSWVRYQKRARLDFGTKLGMNSPF